MNEPTIQVGALVAIGGAAQAGGDALRAFYQRSGGEDGCIVLIPTASQRPDAGPEAAAAFAGFGLKQKVQVLAITQRSEADLPEHLAALQDATGIYLTGGNQIRLTAILGGTRLHQAILAAHASGVTVGGTSAGSSALSSLMIANGGRGMLPRGRMAEFAAGLGLVHSVVFDQHFRQRNRLGRLIYAVISNPGLLGVGIDENTAAILEGSLLSVSGATTVTIVDGSGVTESNVAEIPATKPVTVSGVRLHILSHGSTFDLQSRCAVLSQP